MRFAAICSILCLTASVDGYTSSVPFTKEPALWSLRCLNAGPEKCTSALTEYDLPETENATFPELEQIFVELDNDVKAVFIKHDLASLTRQQACKIPKPLLLLLSAEHLKFVPSEVLGWMLGCNVDDLAIVRLIAETVKLLTKPYEFYTVIQSMKLNENVLSILGEGVKSINYTNSAQWFTSELDSILEYIDPEIILRDYCRILHFMRNINPDAWRHRPQRIKRIWSYALGSYVQDCAVWGSLEEKIWGHLLCGSTVDELRRLDPVKIHNKTEFFQLPFMPLQVRGLFSKFYGHQNVNRAMYPDVKNLIQQLLPKHLQQFDDEVIEFSKYTVINGRPSLSNSLQIGEYLAFQDGRQSLKELISTKEGLTALNQLLYSLPLNAFKNLNYTLSYKEPALQNHWLSLGQLYYLTNGGSNYKLSIDGIYGAHDVLRGLPAHFLTRGLPPTVFIHLASELSATSPPRTAALLDNLLFSTGNEKNIKSLFKNRDAQFYLSFFPSKYIEQHQGPIFQALEQYVKQHPAFADQIPEHLLSVIFTRSVDRSLRWDTFAWNSNSTIYPLLLRSLTCTDIRLISPLEFIHVISRFNTVRSSHGWQFPKNLRLCCLKKFVEYLETKSSYMTRYLSSGLVSLMSSSDIEAVGGYILAQMPLMEMRMSRHRDLIFKLIGQLSLPELLVCARIDRLVDIGELFYRPNIGRDLFKLGNLTAFLTMSNIVGLDAANFKLMLEAGYMDKRVCATDKQRDAWSTLILEAFGSADKWTAQDLVTLGDMMLVLPLHVLAKVDPQVWAEAADLIANTRYDEMIDWHEGYLPFYKVCEKLLVDLYEANMYRQKLGTYVGWLLSAAQYQMDTVLNATSMRRGLRRNPLARSRTADTLDDIKQFYDESLAEDGYSLGSVFPFASFRDKRQGNLATRLTCNAIRIVGKPSELFITVSTIDEMGEEEVENCKEIFGKLDLPKDVGSHIWSKLNKENAVHLAGKLLAHAGPVDVTEWKLSLDEKWSHEILYYLSRYNELNDTKSAVIKSLEDQKLDLLSLEQVVALGELTCELPDARMTPHVFFKASRHLGSILSCNYRCLHYFAPMFENVDAYGPISLWTAEDVESLGILVAGLSLESWKRLIEKPQVLARLGSEALNCLPPEFHQALTEDAIVELPETTSAILFHNFAMFLNGSVKTALGKHLNFEPDFQTPHVDQIEYVFEKYHYVPRIREISSASSLSVSIVMESLVFLIAAMF